MLPTALLENAGRAAHAAHLAAGAGRMANASAGRSGPIAAVVSGDRLSDKLETLHALAGRVDLLVIGGGLANTFLLAAGHAVGRSPSEPGLIEAANDVIRTLRRGDASLFLPNDVVVTAEGGQMRVREVGDVRADETIVDFGPQSMQRLARALGGFRTVLCEGAAPTAGLADTGTRLLDS